MARGGEGKRGERNKVKGEGYKGVWEWYEGEGRMCVYACVCMLGNVCVYVCVLVCERMSVCTCYVVCVCVCMCAKACMTYLRISKPDTPAVAHTAAKQQLLIHMMHTIIIQNRRHAHIIQFRPATFRQKGGRQVCGKTGGRQSRLVRERMCVSYLTSVTGHVVDRTRKQARVA